MLTIDVKHPDIFHFINVKKMPNWVTNQIVEQCKWSGMFDDSQMDVLKKNIMENTQVRFANISIKVSDEFMHAVEEQKMYTKNEYIVYLKNNVSNIKEAQQTDKDHYSVEIPSKNIEREFEQISERIDRPNPFEEAIDVLSDIYDDLVDLELTEEFNIDIENYLPSYDEMTQAPLPITPEVSRQALATNNMPVSQTGLTQTEQGLLSDEEKAIRLRQRGIA